MLKIKPDGKLYILQLWLMFGICLCMVLQRPNVVSRLFYLTFIVLAFSLVLQLYHKPRLNELHMLAIGVIVL